MEKFETPQGVWDLLEKGKEHHRRINLFDRTRRNYDFYEGRQWEGLKSDVMPPVNNIIKHIVQYKHNTMAMQDIQTVFSTDNAEYEEYANALNEYAEELWQKNKLHDKLWRMAKAACITGDHYLYFADERNLQLIDNIDMHLSNENDKDIQSQKYILITERLFVEDIKKKAKERGISADELDLIISDEDYHEAKDFIEVKSDNGKCTSILLMWKDNGTVHYLRAVKNLIYEKETDTELKLYPVVSLVINERKWSARGIGEVEPLINNQIALNKTLYRRVEAIKDVAFPRLIYDETKLKNPEALNKVGGKIAISGNANRISELISFLQPSYVGNDAKELTDELILTTKELNGSGDGATGQINPEKVSGEAVKAVTAQASIASSENQAAYKQLIEDIGLLIIEWWRNYHPNGIKTVVKTDEGEKEVTIPAEMLEKVKLDINVAPATPYDRFSVEQILKELFISGAITIEEYVNALDDNGNMPKAKLQKILKDRENAQNNQYMMIINELQRKLARYEAGSIKGE